MVESIGSVVELDGASATIEIPRRSACGHCQQGGSCASSVIGSMLKSNATRIQIRHHPEIRLGQQIQLSISAATLLQATLVVYLLPLLLMISSAVLLDHLQMPNSVIVLATLSSLGLGLWLGNSWSNRQHQSQWQPTCRTIPFIPETHQ